MGYVYDKERGDKAVGFIETLTFADGNEAGQPFRLRDWQKDDIIRPLFGRVDEKTGLRQYREFFGFMPRKQGKSALVAAIAVYCFIGLQKVGQQIIFGATDREQASIVFRDAAQMIRSSSWLAAECSIIESQKRIIHHPTNSVMRAVSADAGRQQGLRPSVCIIDELHVHRNSDLFNALRLGMGNQKEPLMITITTAGINDKNTLCWQKWNHAMQCRDNPKFDERFLPVLYQAEPDADIWDEKTWYAANPALGDFIEIEDFRAYANEAKNIPSQENEFRRMKLNQWTQQHTRWLPIHKWDEASEAIDESEFDGLPCWAGVDLSSTEDITALELIFPIEDGSVKVISRYWLPEETAKVREKRDGVPYSTWARQKLITLTDGNYIDTQLIKNEILRMADRYDIKAVAFDKFSAADTMTDLMNQGLNVIAKPYRMNTITVGAKKIERLVSMGQLIHGGNEVLRWMANNVEIKQNGFGDIMPDKTKSTEKIDGIVALCLAVTQWLEDIGEGNLKKEIDLNYQLIVL